MSPYMQNFDDKQLLEEFRNNNIEVFEAFFKAQQPYMVAYANKFLDNWETARDIVQEIFISLWENKDKIEIHSTLKAYLFSATKNQCLNNFKHKLVEQKHTNKTLDEFRRLEYAYYSENDEPYLILQHKELDKKIEQIINALPEQCRLTFELSRYQGMKSKEIANKMDISVRTVETQIYRALKALKLSLKDYLSFF